MYADFINRKFYTQDVHIVASGPSLYGFDYRKLDGLNVIAVNHAYKMCRPIFTVAVDVGFIQQEDPEAPNRTKMVCRKLKNYPGIPFEASKEFSLDPEGGVYTIKSSGASAVTIALQAGAKNVFLYGFDCQFFDQDTMREVIEFNGTQCPNKLLPEKMGHATSGMFKHRKDIFSHNEREDHEKIFKRTIKYFEVFPREKIFNMSKWSAIPYFEKL